MRPSSLLYLSFSLLSSWATLTAAQEGDCFKPSAELRKRGTEKSSKVKRTADGECPGIDLLNMGKDATFYFYNNKANGNGWASPEFDNPTTSVFVKQYEMIYIPLDISFKGRVQRSDRKLYTTWAEFQLRDDNSVYNDGHAHGDISLQQGCDGAATIEATDGSGSINGFTDDILSKAPKSAVKLWNADGTPQALDTTMGNWDGSANSDAISYLEGFLGTAKAYIVGGTGVPDVKSTNNRLRVTFY